MTRSVLITGAGRGIGLELARQYAADAWRVFACARAASDALAALAADHDALSLHRLEVTNATELAALSRELEEQPIDVLILNAGIYGPKGLGIGEVDPDTWMRVLAVNTVAPWMIVQALLPQLLAGERKTVAAVSSKVGSMADNTSGRNIPYRSSKAALNQVVKTLAIELRDRGVTTVALHPGWVRTEMGGPGALIDADESARGMRQVIAALGPEQSGSFLAYDGSELPW